MAVPPVKGDSPPTNYQGTHTERERQYRLDVGRFWLEIITLLAIIGYAVITFFLYKEAVGTGVSAKISAEAAKISAEAAMQALRTEFGADVIIEMPTKVPSLVPDQRTDFPFTIKNTGQGHARVVSDCVWILDHSATQKPPIFTRDQVQSRILTFEPEFPLPAGREMSVPCSWDVSQVDMDRIDSRERLMYFSIMVGYSDRFVSREPVQLCVRYEPAPHGGDPFLTPCRQDIQAEQPTP